MLSPRRFTEEGAMPLTVIGLFAKYGQAEAAVAGLEHAGIVGQEVEMISDTDRDGRAGELGMKPHETLSDRIARVFGKSAEHDAKKVYDDSGDMPSYIGEQEFYATHVRAEGAILVVRVPTEKLRSVAEEVLTRHGSKKRDGNPGVMAQ
jgi:hypothetical protein